MFATFLTTLRELVRSPGIVVWALVFPLVLSGVFSLMFSPLDEQGHETNLHIAVVEPGDAPEDIAFKTFIQAMAGETGEDAAAAATWGADDAVDTGKVLAASESANADATADEAEPTTETGAAVASDSTIAASTGAATPDEPANSPESADGIFTITYADNATEAERLVLDSAETDEPLVGWVQMEDGVPVAHVMAKTDISGLHNLYSSILVMVLDEYTAHQALVKELLTENPAALADPAVAESLFTPIKTTVQVQLTENQPKESVRYYFALLGMAALFGASVGLFAFQRLKPNASALGARRTIGALSHGRTVAATLLACWCMSFLCLVVAYLFIRFACKVDFGGRDLPCLVVIAVSSLMATSLGCAISAIPKMPENAKDGLLTGIVCLSALFAGLYGQPTMELADNISRNFPVVELINPASQIAQAFYSIMYYSDYVPLTGHLIVLLAMTVVFFLLSSRSLARRRYASI